MPSPIFCGVIHHDTFGPGRLEHVLSVLRPDWVGVEFDENRLELARRARRLARDPSRRARLLEDYHEELREDLRWERPKVEFRPNRRLVRQLVRAMDYEVFIAQKYCARHSIPLAYTDPPKRRATTPADYIKDFIHPFATMTFPEYYVTLARLYRDVDLATQHIELCDMTLDPSEVELAVEQGRIDHFRSRILYAKEKIDAQEGVGLQLNGVVHVFGKIARNGHCPNLCERYEDSFRLKLCDANGAHLERASAYALRHRLRAGSQSACGKLFLQ